MPSRGDRRRAELVLRTVALVVLGALLVGALRRSPAGEGGRRPEAHPADALPRWTVAPPADTLVLALTAVPDPETRAWLAALRRAGTAVRWTDGGIPAVAVEAVPRAGPLGGAVLRVAGGVGLPLAVYDDAGLLDSLAPGPDGAALLLPEPVGALRVEAPGQTARAAIGRVGRRRVVVLGPAGWETRFVLAALEDRGWEVDARIALAPGRYRVQGRPFPLDTSRHGAVVLLDSVPADVVSRVVRFVRAGGGAVVGTRDAPPGARQWLPGVPGEVVRPSVFTFASAEPRAALTYRPLTGLRPDAVPLEVRDADVVVAARRERAGRIVQIGYEDTWRWRMQGGDGAPGAHAAWWSELVAAATYRPADAGSPADEADPAPYAALVEALGPPSEGGGRDGRAPGPWYPWLLAVAVGCLVGEWASRRLRGMP